MDTPVLAEDSLDAIRIRRMQTLMGVWELLVHAGWLDPKHVKVLPYLATEVVEHYIVEMQILKVRYRIPDRIQPPKIAGLMTSAILRYRPIVPLVDECFTDNQMHANEILAIVNGISVCADRDSQGGIASLIAEPWFDRWYQNFLFLLHHRNFTSESLNFIYETLCCFKFPQTLEMLKIDDSSSTG